MTLPLVAWGVATVALVLIWLRYRRFERHPDLGRVMLPSRGLGWFVLAHTLFYLTHAAEEFQVPREVAVALGIGGGVAVAMAWWSGKRRRDDPLP